MLLIMPDTSLTVLPLPFFCSLCPEPMPEPTQSCALPACEWVPTGEFEVGCSAVCGGGKQLAKLECMTADRQPAPAR